MNLTQNISSPNKNKNIMSISSRFSIFFMLNTFSDPKNTRSLCVLSVCAKMLWAGPFHLHLPAKHLYERNWHCCSWTTMLYSNGFTIKQPSERYLHVVSTFVAIVSKARFLSSMTGIPHSGQTRCCDSEHLKHKQWPDLWHSKNHFIMKMEMWNKEWKHFKQCLGEKILMTMWCKYVFRVETGNCCRRSWSSRNNTYCTLNKIQSFK